MRTLLAIGLAGLLVLPWLPATARGGAAVGWIAAGALEMLTLRARLRGRACAASPLPALVGGFLARMVLLIGGTLLGASAALWSPVAFLAACAAGLLLGEGCAFALLGRSGPPTDPASPR